MYTIFHPTDAEYTSFSSFITVWRTPPPVYYILRLRNKYKWVQKKLDGISFSYQITMK